MKARLFPILIVGIVLFFTGCFKKPVAPELPAWQTPLNFPLLEKIYDLTDLQNDSTITVTDTSLGHLTFVFSDTMESVGISSQDLQFDAGPPITVPALDVPSGNLGVTQNLSEIDQTPDAMSDLEEGDTLRFFPATQLADETDTLNIALPPDVPFFKTITRYTVDEGEITFEIDNQTPLTLDTVQITLSRLDGTMIQQSLNSTPPYTVTNVVMDLSGKEMTDVLRVHIYLTNESVTNEVLRSSPSITVQPSINITNIRNVTGVTKDTTYTDTLNFPFQNPGVRLRRGVLHNFLGTPVEHDSNAMSLRNWMNYVPADFNMELEFKNIYQPNHPPQTPVTLYDTLLAGTYDPAGNQMVPSGLAAQEQYPFSLSRDTIRAEQRNRFLDSMEVIVRMHQIGSDQPQSSVGEQVTLKFPIEETITGQVEVEPMQFDRMVAAIYKSFPPIKQTIDKIPEGFSGLGFQKVRLITNFYDQIPIDTVLLNINFTGHSAEAGLRELDVRDIPLATPSNTPTGSADFAGTEIIFGADSVVRVFHGGVFITERQTNLAIQDLVNDVPDSISVTANATMNGEATLMPGDSLWGNFAMEAPFFVSIKDTMRFIPVDSTRIDTLQPDTRDQLRETLQAIELRTTITNHLGFQGAMSLLVSDKGLFPLLGDDNQSDSTFQVRNDSLYINNSSKAFSYIDTLFTVTLPAISRFSDPEPGDSVDYNYVVESGVTSDTTMIFRAADTTKVNILTSDKIYYIKPLIEFYPTPEPISVRPADYLEFNSRVTFLIQIGEPSQEE